MRDVEGDLWTYPADVRAITTNGFVKASGECVMGRGCAREARDFFPDLARRLGALITTHGNRCFRIVCEDETLLTFPVKHHWKQKADPLLIEQSARQAVEMADRFGWEAVVLPRPGCGNGGLRYSDVRPLIESILDDRFLVITHPHS